MTSVDLPPFAARLAVTADSHRVKAGHAVTSDEREHWAAEAERFEALAELAATDSEAARRAYRPTRSYEPEDA